MVAENSNILKEIRPRLLSLVDELVAKGAERYAVVYMIEKESSQLRDVLNDRASSPGRRIEEPSNDWPAAGEPQ